MGLFTKTTIPIHSYHDYSIETRENIHYADQWLPVLSFFYVLLITLIYVYQCCRRCHKFDPNIIPIHWMGVLALLSTLIYIGLLFVEAHDGFNLKFFDSCLTTQRVHLISLVVVKYFTTWIFIFNLSYMNQSPFFNPRYKYITKKRRKFLHFLFLSFKIIIGLFMPIGILSAYRRVDYNSFISQPNGFKYCYMTFDLKNFFLIFATDILGVILYGLLFGRNACKLTRRKMKPRDSISYVNPNDLATSSKYDLDDPIQKSLLINGTIDPNINNINKSPSTSHTNTHSQSQSHSHSHSHSHTPSSSSPSENDNKPRSRRGSLSASGTVSRESSVISGAEDNVVLQEHNGVKELTRVLRLIWFMFIFYWLNVLLYVFLGLYTSSASIALVANATCILLLNDYEFSSTYWSIRSSLSRCCCFCCIVWCHLWCGQRKYSIDHEDMSRNYMNYDDDTVYSVSYESSNSSRGRGKANQYYEISK